jgi:hypothetical protein
VVSESNLLPRRTYGADPGTLLFAGALPFAGRSNTGGARSSKSSDGFSKALRRSAMTAGARVSDKEGHRFSQSSFRSWGRSFTFWTRPMSLAAPESAMVTGPRAPMFSFSLSTLRHQSAMGQEKRR